MNYYEHHLGDYAAATAHLTWDEDMAYARLIRAYYHHERPIPADIKDACRLARATTATQRKAVETVLREFFELQADGWHQKRCDAEIDRYLDKQAKAKRSAQARWNNQQSHSEGNANAMRTHSEGNALQTPDTRQKTSEANASGVPPPGPTAEPPDPVKAIFDLGVSVLTATGSTDRAARSLVGKVRKALGDDGAMAALVAAKATTDPAAYLAAAMQPDPVADEIRQRMGGGRVEKLPDGRYRCGGSYFNADGSKRVSLC